MNTSTLYEIFRTPNGCVYQCDQTSKFVLDFAGHTTAFSVLCFFSLKRKVDKINLVTFFSSDSSGIEIINPCGSERIYVLSASQLAEFKELLDGAKVMLELNSIIKLRIYSPLV
jgi:hypothetical protein